MALLPATSTSGKEETLKKEARFTTTHGFRDGRKTGQKSCCVTRSPLQGWSHSLSLAVGAEIVEKELELSKVNCTFGRQRPKAGECTQHDRRDYNIKPTLLKDKEQTPSAASKAKYLWCHVSEHTQDEAVPSLRWKICLLHPVADLKLSKAWCY